MLSLRDVLLNLSQRRKVLEASESIGHDNGGRRNDYLLCRDAKGKITQTYPAKKGFVRLVQLKTKVGQLDQPVPKICLLMEAEES